MGSSCLYLFVRSMIKSKRVSLVIAWFADSPTTKNIFFYFTREYMPPNPLEMFDIAGKDVQSHTFYSRSHVLCLVFMSVPRTNPADQPAMFVIIYFVIFKFVPHVWWVGRDMCVRENPFPVFLDYE